MHENEKAYPPRKYFIKPFKMGVGDSGFGRVSLSPNAGPILKGFFFKEKQIWVIMFFLTMKIGRRMSVVVYVINFLKNATVHRKI